MDPLLAIIVIGGCVIFLKYIYYRLGYCKNENTNSMGNLFMDHYHFSGFTNPINNDSVTWYWGAKTGAAAEGYIIFDGNPTSNCIVKVSAVVTDPSTKQFVTLTRNISFQCRVSGC